MMNGRSKTWAMALLVGVLLLGGIAGAAVDRTVIGAASCPAAEGKGSRGDRDDDRYAGYLDWLSGELSLSAEQRAEVERRIEAHRSSVKELWREMRPRYEEMKAQLRNEIRAVLNEDQVAAYEALLEKDSDKRRHRHEEESKQR